MCFSERQSYINTFLLVATAIYKIKSWRLSVPLVFLALKDLIQGLLYHFQGDEKTLLTNEQIINSEYFINYDEDSNLYKYKR